MSMVYTYSLQQPQIVYKSNKYVILSAKRLFYKIQTVRGHKSSKLISDLKEFHTFFMMINYYRIDIQNLLHWFTAYYIYVTSFTAMNDLCGKLRSVVQVLCHGIVHHVEIRVYLPAAQ